MLRSMMMHTKKYDDVKKHDDAHHDDAKHAAGQGLVGHYGH